MTIAFVTGCHGQDGSYLCELLLSRGYEVHGLVRYTTTQKSTLANVRQCMSHPSFHTVFGDVTDPMRIRQIVNDVQPDEVYNLAAQSHVGMSFEIPEQTALTTGVGALNVLEAVRALQKPCKFLQASSSEMFGKVDETPQNEQTRFHPRSPYGAAKVFAHHMMKNYRESYGMFAVGSIAFNHESERRGPDFVTRKISLAVANIVAGRQEKLVVGNTGAMRDWGYAPDYVEAMWMMLQAPKADDYVIGTGEMHSVQEFIEVAFDIVNLDHKKYVIVDPALYRPAEVDTLCADNRKIYTQLGWKPKTTFQDLVAKMVNADLRATISAETRHAIEARQ